MPARPKIPDPAAGPLPEFAFGLRQLGAGKVSIAYIADQASEHVSRAALYAAVSGTRLPDRRTVAMLLRWWAGHPGAEHSEPLGPYADPDWSWIDRLPPDHEGRSTAQEWKQRYEQLASVILRQRSRRRKAAPVRIALPPEHERFIGELRSLIEATGLDDSRWLLFSSAGERRIESYLAGTYIPTREQLSRVVAACAPHTGASQDEMVNAFERLNRLADHARAARRRDQRIAREERAQSEQRARPRA